ncbi:hypothetical protein [Nesterenkonia pannonica]|uniref:hypothetical protein n=1 Tax=Nesterenkonia pannonica TaxID=1548602 RepID=UPI002164993E|nr:hypothetical protein [Nesterenkonia pannonica]
MLIETLVSGISRGTEGLVARGQVPSEIAHLMRAPNQLGSCPFRSPTGTSMWAWSSTGLTA